MRGFAKDTMNVAIEFVIVDITKIEADAIAYSANKSLIKGSNMCKSIFEVAGEAELTEVTKCYAPLEVGVALVTPAFNLPAKYLIHVVTPKYYVGFDSADNIRSFSVCYVSILKAAAKYGAKTVAIPCLGVGNHGWEIEKAASIALDTVRWVLGNHNEYCIEKVVFVCYDQKQYDSYIDRKNECNYPKFNKCCISQSCGL